MKIATKRAIGWGSVVVVVLLLLIWALMPRPLVVDSGQVDRGLVTVTLDEEGETRVRQRFMVSAPVAGRVLRIEHQPGDSVTAGVTVLVVIQPGLPQPLDEHSRQEATAQARAARSTYEQARAELDRLRQEADFADRELQRLENLAVDGIVSDEAVDLARLKAQTQAEATRAAEFAVGSARFESERALVRLRPPSGADAGEPVEVLAPVDGVVLQRLRESEAMVPRGEPLIEVADLSRIEIVADFLSSDAVRIAAGQRVVIEQWGGDQTLDGVVRRVEPFGITKISALGVEEQRVNVIIDFEPPSAEGTGGAEDAEDRGASMLGDGYRVEVRVVTWHGDDVLRVPTNALFRAGDGWAVYAVEEDRARLRSVELGHRTPRHCEIVSGLAEGQMVIVHPSEDLADGQRVEGR